VTRYLSRDVAAVAAAAGAPVITAAILLPWRTIWANTNVALLLVAVVVGVAAIGNRFAAALAAIWAALCFDYFFTVPYGHLTIHTSADVTTVAVLLAVSMAVSQLAIRARRLKVLVVTDAGYLAQIRETASLAQVSSVPDVVVDHVRQQLSDLLDLQDCRFEYGVLLGQPPRLDQDGVVRGGYGRLVFQRHVMPGEEIELRVSGNGQYYGRFMMRPKPGARPSPQARLTAITLADLAGQALGATRPARQTQ
jgi:uncharacterized protein DUF4118